MKAVITVTGKDTTGIIARVSALCAESGVNIVDISQSVLAGEYFAMTMLVELKDGSIPFSDFVDKMNALAKELALDIRTMHEDIFNSMHRI